MIDGIVLPCGPIAAYIAGNQQRVPVIIGVNSLEMGFRSRVESNDPFQQFGERASDARMAYDIDRNESSFVAAAIASDRSMVEPARFVARTLSSAGQLVREYRFSYVAESMRKEWKGAPHASEIPYVFDTVKARYGDSLTEQDEKAAHEMHAYWVQFAKSGIADPAGLPPWPAYSVNQDMLLNFTEDGPVVEADPWKKRLDLIETSQK
jgi:para-nitrobenzyl esterase